MSNVVVTGSTHGIGAALVRRLVADGHRVVEIDREAPVATRGVAAITADLSTAEGVDDALAATREVLGHVDVFVGNAGIESGRGIEAAETDWALSWELNVMAHVRASRALIPDWLERGAGRYIMTVSAAGLLTMLGSPTYSVSKHAALAYGEWLSATYGHRGIAVQAVCPLGVNTRMIEQAGPMREVLAHDPILEPDDVAEAIVQAMAGEEFLILPHPQVAAYYRARANDPDRWLAGMHAIQARIDAAP